MLEVNKRNNSSPAVQQNRTLTQTNFGREDNHADHEFDEVSCFQKNTNINKCENKLEKMAVIHGLVAQEIEKQFETNIFAPDESAGFQEYSEVI